ncbi:MAG TPA: PspC domain-containing protein [Candidatus Acidoferrales bacterium]|nr:PspC domain-containing protein [Candidatus Acidoferrales bacterium]
MVCLSCQKDIVAGSRFCYLCGAKQPDTPVAAAPPARKRLMRSVTDKKIAGVCGGLADFFDLDATVIRIVWLLAFFLGGVGGLAYIICWIAMPEAPAGYVSPSGVTAS